MVYKEILKLKKKKTQTNQRRIAIDKSPIKVPLTALNLAEKSLGQAEMLRIKYQTQRESIRMKSFTKVLKQNKTKRPIKMCLVWNII